MAQPPKHIPPELNTKWLGLRRKHYADTKSFQRMVTKSRQEFESRVDAARDDLLAKHIREESEFWGKHSRAAGTAKAVTPAVNSARMQTPSSARGSISAPRGTAPPASRSVMPSRPQNLPVTPSKVSRPQVPPAPRRPQKVGKGGTFEIVDLCSDDEDDPPTAIESPTLRKQPTQRPIPRPLAVEVPVGQDSMGIDEVQNNTSFSVPEASIELFDTSPLKHLSTPTRPHIKDEEALHSSPNPASPFAKMDMSSPKIPKGLPSPKSASHSPQRASTVMPQTGSSEAFGSPASSSTPYPGSWNGVGLYVPVSGFSHRARSPMPTSRLPSGFNDPSPFFNMAQPNSNAHQINESPPGLLSRQASVAPPSPSFTFQSQPLPQNSSLVSQVLEPKAHPCAELKEINQQQHEHLAVLDNASVQNECGHSVAQEPQNSETVRDVNVEMQDASPRAEDARMSGTQAFTTPSATAARYPSPFEHLDSVDASSSRVTGADVRGPREHIETQQLPTPPPSHASVMSEPVVTKRHDASTIASNFKKPSLPASAAASTIRQPIAPQACHVRAGTIDSRASSFTLPTSPHSQRGTSVTSRTSGISGRTGAPQNRKRKVEVNLSSDEDEDSESDYAPSEPDSPLGTEPMRQAKSTYAVKKSKVNDGSGVAAKPAPQVERFMEKNGFGFKITPVPKPRVGAASATSSGIPSKNLTHIPTPAPRGPPPVRASSVRSSTEAIQPKPKAKAAFRKTLNKKPIPQPSKRYAAIAAEHRIQGYFEDTEEFETECAIEEADHMEDARLPEDMRRMSLTPAPTSQKALVDADAESMDMLVGTKSPKGFNSWTQTRGTGDRAQLKSRFQAIVADADDSEPDISEYMFIDGVILSKHEVEELDLTGETQITTSEVIGAGKRGGKGIWKKIEGCGWVQDELRRGDLKL